MTCEVVTEIGKEIGFHRNVMVGVDGRAGTVSSPIVSSPRVASTAVSIRAYRGA